MLPFLIFADAVHAGQPVRNATRPRAGRREVAHTGTLSPEGRGPGLHNQLFRARTDPVGTVPMPLGMKAPAIGPANLKERHPEQQGTNVGEQGVN